ncbi:hypothetical protein RU08_16840 [Pseudomonas fulva]|uniref:Uncharacterized protein n=1 Tax=Pseudomonas fulva TaxID=47880 RepID=A0A0D0IYM7_9PSED|nr:hypothetical protein RU08_16840 [Pseudomonas fulva]
MVGKPSYLLLHFVQMIIVTTAILPRNWISSHVFQCTFDIMIFEVFYYIINSSNRFLLSLTQLSRRASSLFCTVSTIHIPRVQLVLRSLIASVTLLCIQLTSACMRHGNHRTASIIPPTRCIL